MFEKSSAVPVFSSTSTPDTDHRRLNSSSPQQGTLYLVSTPIGNLEDISFRAVQVLSQVSLIAAEDTRTTKILLDHYNIRTAMISYFSRNEIKRVPYLMGRLERGDSIAVVTESGTPGISDPACRLVRAALKNDLPVVSIPGPTAFLTAFVVSDFQGDAFVFEGFLPKKKRRAKILEQLNRESRPIILYESPHRILRTLGDLRHCLGDRRIVVARELTKKFEEILRGSISEVHRILLNRKIRGEFVIVIEGRPSGVRPLRRGS